MTHTQRFMKTAVVLFASLAFLASPVEAKRLGGGAGAKIGKPANTTAAPKQAAPTPAAAAPAAAAPAAAAAKPANKWMGPLAGLAAGLGIAALMSHFGMGDALAGMMTNLLIFGGLAFLALFIYRRFFAKPAPQMAAASNYDAQPQAQPLQNASAYQAPAALASGTAAHPAIPDAAAFTHNAKQQYASLQAAWDAGDMAKLRNMTNDALFMELAQQIANRKGAPNHTEILNLHCELLNVGDEGDDTVATLRFTGTAREDGAPTAGFEDVWTLVKPRTANSGWLLAGVESV
jgi:predicted lipid-binding transport protein (Tim44 family)